MLVKYGESVTPFRKEKNGVTFFTGTRTPSAATGQKNDRWRYPKQNHSRWPLIHLARLWRTLSNETRELWNLWAQTYPQPAEFPASGFLNGYQAFIRRNYWKLYADGFDSELMLSPEFSDIDDTDLSLELVKLSGTITLNFDYGRNDSTIDSYVFISMPVSHGRSYSRSAFRYICKIENSGGVVIKYGNLFNWFCGTDPRNIAPVGFHVPSRSEYETLISFLGGSTVAGGKAKVTGLDFWNSPNTGATNEYGFNGKGSGARRLSFQLIKQQGKFWTNQANASGLGYEFQLVYNSASFPIGLVLKFYGGSLRFIKNDSTLIDTVTGNDGKIYPCTKIGTQVWTAQNSCETKFQNGDLVPFVENQSAWEAMTSPATCYYNNDQSNSFTAGENSIDITDMFYNMFGLLPVAGQKVLIKVLSFAKHSGQKISESTSYLYVQ